MRELSPELIKRYEAAVYRVRDAGTCIEFRVNVRNPELDRLLDTHKVETAAFITAHNPASELFSPADNDLAHDKLCEALEDSELCWLTGDGIDPDGDWIAETSTVVLSIDLNAATALASRFGQNAFVWIERGQRPRLVFT